MILNNEELIIPGDWIPVIQKILKEKSTVIVLGKTDTGKTSFIKAIARYLVIRNRKVIIIDGDIGQSSLGPPGTVNMCFLDFQRLKCTTTTVDEMIFIGHITPAECLGKLIHRVDQLYKISQRYKSDTIIIDTTGLVSGDTGIHLKSSLIEKIKPSMLIAFQAENELESIINKFTSQYFIQIFCLKSCQFVKRKNWRERKSRREKKYESYFQNLILKGFDFSTGCLMGTYYGHGKLLERKEVKYFSQKYKIKACSVEIRKDCIILITDNQKCLIERDEIIDIKNDFKVSRIILIPVSWFQYFLVSFNNKAGLSEGLGIIEKINFREKNLTTYLPGNLKVDNFCQIEIGKLRVKPNGTELNYTKPSSF